MSPLVLVPPDWEQPGALHTDASECAAGAVLTQLVEDRDAAIGFGSHRWTRAKSRRAPTDREVRAALFGLEHFRTYLLHRPFTLVTDCSAITWLFRQPAPVLHDVQVRTAHDGAHDDPPVAQHRAHSSRRALPPSAEGPPGTTPRHGVPRRQHEVIRSHPRTAGDSTRWRPSPEASEDDEEHGSASERADVDSGEPPGSTPALDGAQLATLGTTEATAGPALSLPIIWALQHRLEPPEPWDHARLAAYEETREAFTPRRPRAVLGCGAGGALLALGEMLEVDTAVDPDWTALECARANDWGHGVNLVRTTLASLTCKEAVAVAEPEILIGNACRRCDPDGIGNTASR